MNPNDPEDGRDYSSEEIWGDISNPYDLLDDEIHPELYQDDEGQDDE